MDTCMLLKILKYIALFSVIYLGIRYLPISNISSNNALCITLSIVILFIIVDYGYSKLGGVDSNKEKELFEHFGAAKTIEQNTTEQKTTEQNTEEQKDKTCTTCDTDKSKLPQGKKCRVVCDDDGDNKETVDPNYGGMFYDENPYYNRYNTGINPDRNTNDLDAHVRATSTEGYHSRYQATGSKSQIIKNTENQRRIVGELDDELPYTDYNHLPVASGYKSKDYEYGYSFIPPEKWYPQPPRPPICVTEKRCSVCPSMASGTPVDVKEFNSSRRITPPDNINVDYINDKLNSGR